MILLFTKGLYGQGHEDLLKIIESSGPNEQKETQLNTFISEYLPKLSRLEMAECLHDLGGKWYYQKFLDSGDREALENAIHNTLKSLELKRRLEPVNQCALNRTLYNLGLFYADSSKEYMALDYLLELIRKGGEYCQGGGSEHLIELAYHEAGDLYMKIGDFFKALEIYNKLISDYTNEDLLQNEGAVWAFLRRAEIYTAIDLEGNSNLVKENLDSARIYLKKIKIPCCFFENRINQLEGNRLSEINAHAESILYHQKVIENLPEDDSVNLAIAYNSLGDSYFKLGKKKLAEEILLKTTSLDRDFDSPHNNLGDIYTSDNRFEKALGSYQKAIDLSLKRSINLQFDELPKIGEILYASNKIELLNHVVTKANGWIKYHENNGRQEHLEHALETFTLADQLVDLIRFESNEQKSKLYWREQSSSLYVKAVEVCHLLDKPENAYHFMERNKALLLLEDLTQEEAKEIAQLPKEAIQREFQLKRNIFLAENDLLEKNIRSIEADLALKDTIREHKYLYARYIDSLNEAYPDYAKFKKKVDILTFKELKANYLSDEQAVLHYILNEEQGYGLLTSADTTLLYRLENIPKLNWDIEVLIHRLSKGNSDRDLFNNLAHTVFQNLIPKNIYNEIKGKQLTIIPDYTLQRIPFEALVVDQANPKYLLEEVEVGYVYSMSLLDQTKRTKRKPTKNLLGLAPVQFNELGLANLNYSGDELKSITNVFDGEIFLNGNASKAHFFEQVGHHKIIHLSTHADIGDGENPWIAFSDSKMYLKEIYATKNQSDMVVLSACNTSNGTLKRGEGLMSLARGFFYSGAKSVVSSLWPVTDDTGQEIMIGFYKNLGQGHSKSKALRKAKLDYLKTTDEVELKHPFYWASFVIIGDYAPVTEGPHGYWKFLMIGTLALLIIIFGPKLFKGWSISPKTPMDVPNRKRSQN